MFFETSAKTGMNVDEIFSQTANQIGKKIDQGYYDLDNDTCGIKKGINRSSQELHLGGDQNNRANAGGCC